MAETTTPAPAARGDPVPSAQVALMEQARDVSLGFCQNEVEAQVKRISESLLRESARCSDRSVKIRLQEVHDAIVGREQELRAALLSFWAKELDRAIASDDPPALLEEFAQTRSQLAIVGEEDVQREILVFRLIRELEELCADTVSTLTLRICNLRNLDVVEVRFNPFRPETFAIGLICGFESCLGSRAMTPSLLQAFRAAQFLPLNALYSTLNRLLINHGVTSKERFIVRNKPRSATSAALWVKSDVIGSLDSEPETGSSGTFSAARFIQQLSLLSEPLGAASATGNSGSGAPQSSLSAAARVCPPSASLSAAVDELIAHMQDVHAAGGDQLAESGRATILGAEQIQALKDATDVGIDAQARGGQEINRSIIEMVSRIFDFILQDSGIPSQLKVMTAELQLPVLKAALNDPTFFLNDTHPARRVVDLLARCGIFWELLPGNEVADTVRREVDRIRDASRKGGEAFAEVAGFMESFLSGLEARYEARLQASLKNVTAQERRAESMPEVDRALELWFDAGPIEDTLARFLRGPWRSVLCEYVVERAQHAEACDAAFAHTALLIWSVQPKVKPVEREHLIRQLPTLLAALNAGLDKIGAAASEREPFLKFLMERHAQAIRPSASASSPQAIPVPKLDRAAPIVASVKRWNALQLSVGDWFVLELPSQPTRRYRLSWVSPKRTKFVFTARESSEALALDETEVERRLRDESLRLVDNSPIVQRAIAATVESGA